MDIHDKISLALDGFFAAFELSLETGFAVSVPNEVFQENGEE